MSNTVKDNMTLQHVMTVILDGIHYQHQNTRQLTLSTEVRGIEHYQSIRSQGRNQQLKYHDAVLVGSVVKDPAETADVNAFDWL